MLGVLHSAKILFLRTVVYEKDGRLHAPESRCATPGSKPDQLPSEARWTLAARPDAGPSAARRLLARQRQSEPGGSQSRAPPPL